MAIKSEKKTFLYKMFKNRCIKLDGQCGNCIVKETKKCTFKNTSRASRLRRSRVYIVLNAVDVTDGATLDNAFLRFTRGKLQNYSWFKLATLLPQWATNERVRETETSLYIYTRRFKFMQKSDYANPLQFLLIWINLTFSSFYLPLRSSSIYTHIAVNES